MMNNSIGKRGEAIFSNIISRYSEPFGFLFDPTFMGEKFSGIDFYVGLMGYTFKKSFFLASVKTTTLGYSSDNSRIKISLDKNEIEVLGKFQVPVYLFGIDENQEKGYFICANRIDNTKNLNGITVKYPVDSDHMKLLWMEVKGYWEKSNEITKFVSSFN